MPSGSLIRRSFNGGEIAAWAEGRTDLPVYRAASRRIENFIATPQGGLVRRPGTRYLRTLTNESRLIDFVVSRSDAYVVVLSDYEMRFIREDGVLNYSDASVKAREINTNSVSIEYEGHGFYHGQKIQLLSTGGAPAGLATSTDYYVALPRAIHVSTQSGTTGRYNTAANHGLTVEMGPYKVFADTNSSLDPQPEKYITAIPSGTQFELGSSKGGTSDSISTAASGFISVVPQEAAVADTFRLSTDPTDIEGNIVNITSQGTGPHVFGTVADEEVVLKTPWSLAEVWELDYTQDRDTLYFFHKNHKPQQLRRFGTSAFILRDMPIEHYPEGDVSPGGVGVDLRYVSGTFTNPDDFGTVEEASCDAPIFKGTDVGTTLRKRYNASTVATQLKYIIGRIERVEGQFAQFTELRKEFWDQPSSNRFTITGHSFVADEIVFLVPGDGTYPAELSERTPYYVQYVDANNFDLATTAGGGAMTLTPGTGTDHAFVSAYIDTVDAAGASANHPFTDGDDWGGLLALGTLPLGLYEGTPYVVRVVDADTVYLEHRDGTIAALRSSGHGRFFLSAGVDATNVHVRLTLDPRETSVSAATAQGRVDEFYTSAWSGERGWPSSATFYEQRLIAANNEDGPERIWASVIGDPYVFSFDEISDGDPDGYDRSVTDSSGFSYLIQGGRTGEIQWLYPGATLLLGGTSAIGELVASTNREALTPSNANAEIREYEGSSAVKPVVVGRDAIYACTCNTKLRAAVFDGASGTFATDDITAISDHVMAAGAKQFARQTEPYGIAWMVRTDGQLWGCTYSAPQALAAWHRHTLGGTDVVVESCAVIPATDDHGENYDRLWLVVKRTVNGSTVRFVEYMDSPLRPGHSDASAYHVDAGLVYSGAAATTFTGFDHLEGETLAVWADAAAPPNATVASGQFTLTEAASTLAAGLEATAIWEGLPFESDLDSDGTLQGVRSIVIETALRLYRSLGGSIGPSTSRLLPLQYRTVSHGMGTGIPPWTGLLEVNPDAGYDDEGVLALQVDGASPFHLVSIIGRLDWSNR